MKDYYNILGVRKDASIDEIRKAYRKLARTYHPDIHKENKVFYENKMKELNEASAVLLHSVKKAEYNNLLAAERERLIREAMAARQTKSKPEPEIKQTPKQKKENLTRLFNQDKGIKALTIFFIIQSIVAILVITISLYVFFIKPSFQATKPSYLNFGQSKQQVIQLLGEPNHQTKHLMIYDNYQIIIYLNKVDGWLDATGQLPVGPQKDVYPKDIDVGDDITRIVDKYGNPDTFAPEVAIYGKTVIYLKDGIVSSIETVK